MTTAEQLEAKGRAEGEARGEARGEAKGRAEALVDLLEVKFAPLPAEVVETVRAASPDDVSVWTRRVLTATALAEVFES